MISTFRLQQGYINLYKQFRNYIWDYANIETLCNLELAVFRACPDISECRILFNTLKSNIQDILSDDEDFKEAVDEFSELLDDTEAYCPIIAIKERIQDEDK